MKYLKIVLTLFLLFEIIFSFMRYEYFPMEGDMPSMIYGYNQVKEDPFGFNVLLRDSVYAGPNRYFAISTASAYINNAPLVFSPFASPLKSVYLAWALFKTITHFLLVYLIAVMITGKKKLWDFDLLLAAALITPLFQTSGYHKQMGIIDYSVTYTFFYAFSFCFIILFFLPFYKIFFHNLSFKLSPLLICMLLLLSVFNAFNGPLNPPVMLIICTITVLHFFIYNEVKSSQKKIIDKILVSIRDIPFSTISIFVVTAFLSIYSIYIGRNNSENLWETIPLAERYERLLMGIYYYLTGKLGYPILLLMIIVNTIIIYKQRQLPFSEKILRVLMWVFIFILLYIFLLPFGGYRNYRPYILRYDTLVPVTLAIIFMYGITTFYLIKNTQMRNKIYYFIAVTVITFNFIWVDRDFRKLNKCEKNALEKIAASKERIIFLDNDCSVINWIKETDYKNNQSRSELLQHWGITKEKKLFYQR